MKKAVETWCSTSLIMRIAAGLVIGAIIGLVFPNASALAILGSVFVGALKSIAPVLVFLLVCSALSRAHSNIGPRFRTVIILYLMSTLIRWCSGVSRRVVSLLSSPVALRPIFL